MDSQYELIRYLFNQYLMFFESEYNFPLIKFSDWLYEVSKLDYYKKEILELKNILI